MNPHVIRSIKWFVGISILALLVIGVILHYSNIFVPSAPLLYWRVLANRTISVIGGSVTVFGMLLFAEVITNGNLLGNILKDSKSCAMFAISLVAVAGAIWIWTS